MARPSIQEHFLKLSPLLPLCLTWSEPSHVAIPSCKEDLLWAALCLGKAQGVLLKEKGDTFWGTT